MNRLLALLTILVALAFVDVSAVRGEYHCDVFTINGVCAEAEIAAQPETHSPPLQLDSPPQIRSLITYSPAPFGSVPCFGPPEGPFTYDLNTLSLLEEREGWGDSILLIPRDPAGRIAGEPILTCSLADSGGAPPPAPSLDEIRASVVELIPQPTVELNPQARGLVGFEVWLWSEVPTAPVSASVEVRGWTATVTATPASYHWTTSTGENLSSPVPGSEAQPAATFAYQHSGDHTVTHSVVWSGTYTLTGYGVTVSDADLGTVEPAASLVQDVVSVEAVGTG